MPDIYAKHLSRDATEVQRIDTQFRFITEALGWAIHPSISAKLPAAPAIADFATGTGLFLRSIAADYPNGRLDGYDISPDMFPSQSDLASSIHLSLLDVKSPLPPELHGVYDLIHVRYLIVGMEPEEWEAVLHNLLLGLKPGGAIQWIEPSLADLQILRGQNESTNAAVLRINRAFRTPAVQRRFEGRWKLLPEYMKKAGLTVETDVVSSDRFAETRRTLTENAVIANVATARKMTATGEPGSMSTEEIDLLEREAQRDIESGCYLRYDIHTTVGFKP